MADHTFLLAFSLGQKLATILHFSAMGAKRAGAEAGAGTEAEAEAEAKRKTLAPPIGGLVRTS